MKFNANPKLLGALGVAVAIFLYMNVFSSDSPAPAPPPAARTGVTPAVPATARETKSRRSATRGGAVEFHPRLGGDPDGHIDPTKIDPTLRLDLLAKVQNVQPEEAVRNLFQYSKPVAPVATAPLTGLPQHVPTISVGGPVVHPPPPPPPGPPRPPEAPRMTFKYYGYKVSKASGRKEAFLLDGDDIFIAAENEPVKGPRYKVVRIGVNSITIEDTQFKSSQTIQLQEEPAV